MVVWDTQQKKKKVMMAVTALHETISYLLNSLNCSPQAECTKTFQFHTWGSFIIIKLLIIRDFWFSRQWLLPLQSSGMWYHVIR
jgi:hypothetical protein